MDKLSTVYTTSGKNFIIGKNNQIIPIIFNFKTCIEREDFKLPFSGLDICDHDFIKTSTKQTRSGDEAFSVFYVCTKCGKQKTV